ncbi:hypothetical protein JD844_014987 [Phrynosoma platyrhinos]|uniref:Uncharacterized protein n=1 Tax=Phrynosoma platyrhinos TaxID=52577 RepID=A0ABQ7T715_PHRPL|nr:hypothetical protein JD844_014987 [Phrynosoma platyrhinos]
MQEPPSPSPSAPEPELLSLMRQKEKDLVLAARLGKALLERNQDMSRQYERMHKELTDKLEVSRAGTPGGGRGGPGRPGKERGKASRGSGKRENERPSRGRAIAGAPPLKTSNLGASFQGQGDPGAPGPLEEDLQADHPPKPSGAPELPSMGSG